MKRWAIGFLLVVLACIPIWTSRASGEVLLRDTDTKVLLANIRERQDPLSWFTGDWPLFNHFYRPISTLTFEFDNWRYGNDPAGYGATNAILAILCVLALFWLLREMTNNLALSTSGAVLFALWNLDRTGLVSVLTLYASFAILAAMLLPGRKPGPAIAAALVGLTLSAQLAGVMPLFSRMIAWLPGRTASTMALFCLLAMAAYARYERLSAERPLPNPTPEDVPATKSTPVAAARPRAAWLWALLAIPLAALAFGSYEQAVMLPAALLGVAVAMRLQRYRVRWGWQAAFWGLLVGYLLLRRELVPSEVSGYQAQQFRDGPGVVQSLLDYLFPAANAFWQWWHTRDLGIMLLVVPLTYQVLLESASNVVTFIKARLEWRWILTGWALSFLAFLPMAWLKHFDHYHYWPMALRSLFVVALGALWLRLIAIAWSPQALAPPPRQAPAPGSLPRP